MPERHHVEEDPLFRVTLRAFAVLMPVQAIVLYVVTAIQPPVWITAAVVSSVLSLVAGRYLDRSRVVRIGMRTLYILIPILLIVLSILLIVQCQTRPHVRRGGDAGIRGGGSGVVAVPMLL